MLALGAGCSKKEVQNTVFNVTEGLIVHSKCKAAMTAISAEMAANASVQQMSGKTMDAAAVQAMGTFGGVKAACQEVAVADSPNGPVVTATLFRTVGHQCVLTLTGTSLADTCNLNQ